MFLNEEEEEGGGRGGRRARDDETYEEPGTLEIIFLQPSYDALPKTKSYHLVLTIFGVYSYSLQYIKLICILLYKIHIYFCQMERHTFAFALSMKIFKATRGVLRGK